MKTLKATCRTDKRSACTNRISELSRVEPLAVRRMERVRGAKGKDKPGTIVACFVNCSFCFAATRRRA